MENKNTEPATKSWCDFGYKVKHHTACHGCRGALYWLGFLGTLYYYLTTATGLLGGILGVIKALLWPAFLVYGVLNYLGM